MDKPKKDLSQFKEEYSVLQKKYSLPSFKELNEDFGIEKLVDTQTETLVREIRKTIGDKEVGYLRFVESLLNPAGASSTFIFSIVKLLSLDEKKKLTEIHKELMKSELKLIVLDTDYKEKDEAEFVKESFKSWQKIKKDVVKIIENVDKNWDAKPETTSNNRADYFG